MDIQDLMKIIEGMNIQNSKYEKFLKKLFISSTKADPIDREEAMLIDGCDLFQEMVCDCVKHYPGCFANPEDCCHSFIRAVALMKLGIQREADEARQKSRS